MRSKANKGSISDAALLSEVKQLTGITDHALARKLSVDVQTLRTCQPGGPPLNDAAREALSEFHHAAVTQGRSLSAPRIVSPHVPDGVVHGDALTVLKELPAGSVDAVISDIPYGISHESWDVLHENSNSALLGSSDAQARAGRVFQKRRKPINGWSAADRDIPRQYYAACVDWAEAWMRVLKPGGSVMVFAGRRFAPRCVIALEDTGFNFRDMLAWVKPRAVFRAQRLSTVLQRRGELAEAERFAGYRVGNLAPLFEPILWCFKPYDVTIADNVLDHLVGAMDVESYRGLTGGVGNVIHAGMARGEGGLHEAQKPVALMRALIELCVPPGGLVLDPFAGSGTTGVAAIESGRRALLIERDQAHATTARARCESARRRP